MAAAGPAAGQSPSVPVGLQGQLDTWFRGASRAAPGEWGVAVADERGQLVWGVNATRPLIPASTVKLFTTGFARTVLGPEARQVTRVVGTGYADSATGTWMGSWALELNGDPTLERPDRSGPLLRDLASQLSAQGIRRLVGPLTVQSASGPADATFPSVWSVRHKGRRFAPLIGSLTLNENLLSFTVAPGSKVGRAPWIAGASPEGVGLLVTIRARTVEGRRNRLRILAQPHGRFLVTGTIGSRARPRYFTTTITNPHAVLEATWEAALTRSGIEWSRAPGLASGLGAQGMLSLAEVVSAPLDSIASEVNTRSLNIGAEALLRWAAGSNGDGGRLLTDHVRQVTGEDVGVYLVDGSGLSAQDRATPYSFVKYLARFPETEAGRNFPLLLPANGTGTLYKLKRGLPGPGVVRAKTGSLGNVATVVGYLGRKEGMLLVSVMYNGSRPGTAKQHQWRLFRVLGANGVVIPSDSTDLGGIPLVPES
jgi:D-alanyl-D-alanine carboxypeptidase/D-alanyl-D-alanine-endopeptidase (penicillin-binding protein 4)